MGQSGLSGDQAFGGGADKEMVALTNRRNKRRLSAVHLVLVVVAEGVFPLVQNEQPQSESFLVAPPLEQIVLSAALLVAPRHLRAVREQALRVLGSNPFLYQYPAQPT